MVHPTRTLLVLVLLLTAAASAAGQQYRGHLRGRVFDPAGTPAPGVPMRITHEPTGESRRFVSGPDGFYVVADLLPGTYRIDADDDKYRGLAARTRVAINHDAELDLHLGMASITTTADVRPTHIPVDRHSPAVTMRPAPALFETLPLESRAYLDVAALAAGTFLAPSGVMAAGTGEAFTGYLADGLTWFADPRLDAPTVRVPLDAIGELEVRTSTFDASFGRAAGAQVSVVTRGGGNRTEASAVGLLQPDGERALFGGSAGGPLAVDRTFAFGSYQFTTVDGTDGDGHLFAGRVDHLLASSSRITARYGLDTTPAAGHAQHAAVSLHSAGAGSFTNEVRFGVAGADTEDPPGPAGAYDATTVQLANTTTWVRGRHLVRGGVQWVRQSRDFGPADLTGSATGLFVQDDWWVRPDVSISAGLRFDHESPATGADDSNRVAPRLGFSWSLDEAATTLVRGGYGIAHNHLLADGPPPRVDHWSVGVRRSFGRARAFEGSYVGSDGRDLAAGTGTSRYHAVQLTFEERSDANLASLVSYTYGRWTEDLGIFDEPVRSQLDSRHRASAAFTAVLPFGDERRWFTGGLAADILGNMELSGIFTLQSGQPLFYGSERQAPSLRNLDAALLKNIALGLRRTLQVRFEIYNLTNNEIARHERRYQLGARIVF
jgi:hypothetical protein